RLRPVAVARIPAVDVGVSRRAQCRCRHRAVAEPRRANRRPERGPVRHALPGRGRGGIQPTGPQRAIHRSGRGSAGSPRQTAYSRWLLIFDNADELEQIQDFIPRGKGHVLITSRNPTWGDRAETVQLEVFRRRESIAHLIGRVPTMTAEDARRVAETLGDLPIA